LLRNIKVNKVSEDNKGLELHYLFVLFQSAESTDTNLFTVMFAMFAWTKDWKENTNANQLHNSTSVRFVCR